MAVVNQRKAMLKRILNKIRFLGLKFYCPICKSWVKKFMPYCGRNNAVCPVCGSFERHRFLFLYLDKETDLLSGKEKISLLHVSPSKCLHEIFRRKKKIEHFTLDIASPLAEYHMDIRDIKFPESKFDVIVCCHVLEHIDDDIKAMKELYRVLKRGGWAILQVPIYAVDKTYELTKEGQEKVRGHGHVRKYGLDYKDRLSSAGFEVKILNKFNWLTKEAIEKYSLAAGETINQNPELDIYFCKKK